MSTELPHAHKKQRIALVASDLAGGGAERFVVNLARLLLDLGYVVDLCLIGPARPVCVEVPGEVRVVPLHSSTTLVAVLRLQNYLRRENPHCLISALTRPNLVAVVSRMVSRHKPAIITTLHCHVASESRDGGLHKRLLPMTIALTSRWSDAIVAVSRDLQTELVDSLGIDAEKTHCIYNPVVSERFLRARLEAPEWVPTSGMGPTIVAVGRLCAQKAFDDLLHAVARIQTHRSVQLVVLGDGPEEHHLKKLSGKLGLGGHVSFPGFVKNPGAVLSRADVFVLSSHWEGLPTVLIEALACGVPIVSTDCPTGPREILRAGRFGRLVPVGKPEALADAIVLALDGQVLPAPRESWERFEEMNAGGRYSALIGDLTRATKDQRVSLFIPSLAGGGAERVFVTIANALAMRGHPVDLVVAREEADYLSLVHEDVRLIHFRKRGPLFAIPRLARYLRTVKPSAALSGLNQANLALVVAVWLSKSRCRTVISIRNTLSVEARRGGSLKLRMMPWFARFAGKRADAVIAVSDGAGADFVRLSGVATSKVRTIYNPLVDEEMLNLASHVPSHPWLVEKQTPVILACGRLTRQKDYPTLLRAFCRVREAIDCRLVILGEGPERARLESLINRLGRHHDVSMPGFDRNPFSAMANADVLALSSTYEGMPAVLVQALACGTPVVATDCPSGPREILDGVAAAILVPPEDPDSLARALLETLRHGKPRIEPSVWRRFEVSGAVDSYLDCLTDFGPG